MFASSRAYRRGLRLPLFTKVPRGGLLETGDLNARRLALALSISEVGS
jgi:hypothetical protein